MTDAAEKYRDRVDPEHAMAMQSIGFAATVVRTHRDKLARLINGTVRFERIALQKTEGGDG